MSTTLFELKDVGFRYDDERTVLESVSFLVHAGERLALTGPNGAGKTTLLELLVGLNKPQRGSITAFGRERTTEEDFHEVRLRAGLLFQDPDDQLFSTTVAEDVAFGPFNLGWSRERITSAVRDTLVRLGLDGYERRITHHLSHGEKRLVCLATVLVMEPDVLLLDEPTEGLDEHHHDMLTELLNDLPCAMLIASHDRNMLETVGTRALHLEGGRLRSAC